MKNLKKYKTILLSEKELLLVKKYLAEANLYYKKKLVADSHITRKELEEKLKEQSDEFETIFKRF